MALFGELAYALIAAPRTSIGGIIPDVVVEEVYRDDLIITDHPVERGAAITDHAFKRPSLIEMRIGFSNASAGAEGYIDAIYQDILRLQGIREPFDVFTPRRRYRNMLIAGITVTRDERSNSVLNMIVACREIIIAFTRQQAAGGNAAAPSSDQAAQAMPEATSGVTDTGSKQFETTVPGSDGFGSTFAPGTNTDFLSPPTGSGLGPSGADAGAGDFVFGDGSVLPGGGATGAVGVAPGGLGGSVGQFGQYAPGAFGLAA